LNAHVRASEEPGDLTTSDVIDLLDAIRAGGDIDVIRKGVEVVLQALVDAEATEVIGAERYERTGERTNWRNGGRDACVAFAPANRAALLEHKLGCMAGTRVGQKGYSPS
jgi:Transposase, Mutator family